jgi:signal transduction histidine kinase
LEEREGHVHAGGRPVLGQRYVLSTLCQRGLTSTSHLARDLQDEGREVLVVLILSQQASSAPLGQLAMTCEELGRHASPHLARVLQCGREEDVLYLVLEHTPGPPLAERLTHGPLPLLEALRLGRALLRGLHALHAAGGLHGALSPRHILLQEGRSDAALVTGFGILSGERLRPQLNELTSATVAYVSPEQLGLLEQPIGPPADLYAVGVVLYECLAGKPPFASETVGELLRQHLTARPDLHAAGVPRAVNELVRLLLRKDPRDRYQSARAALEDLEALLEDLERGRREPDLVPGAHERRAYLAETAFVGRERELALLEAARLQSARGQGELVLVEAESGGGKTRLLDELAAQALAHGAHILRGQGTSYTAQVPYQLFRGVAWHLLKDLQDEPSAMARLRSTLGPHAVAVSEALPQLESILGTPDEPGLGPEALGEQRILAALAALLDALGTPERPALLLLDDAQWADTLTWRVLETWQRRGLESGRRYTLVVLAFRSEEVDAAHPLRSLPAELHVVVGALTPEETRKLTASMAGPLPEEVQELVVQLSQGNPFLASETLRGLVESGALRAAPSGWRVEPSAMAAARASHVAATFLVQRIQLLPEECLQLLRTGAILGREFYVERVAALVGQPFGSVMEMLEEPLRRHILWRSEQGRLTFSHDRLRETLLALMPEEEKRVLHRRIALELRAREEEASFELAYHFDAAGEPEAALPHALAAAEQARRRYALELSERHYRIAERNSEHSEPGLRQRILEGLGDVLMLRGQYEEAALRLNSARALAEGALARARVDGKLGELAFKRGDMEGSISALRRGLGLLGRSVPTRSWSTVLRTAGEAGVQLLHTLLPRHWVARRSREGAQAELLAVRLYSRLAYASWFSQGRMACLWSHLRELNLAERYPDSPELAQAWSEHAPVMTLVPLFGRAAEYAERSLTLRRKLGDTWGQGQSLNFRGVALYCASRLDEALTSLREAVELLERTGDVWEANLAREHIALALYRRGDLREAIAAGQEVVRRGREVGDVHAIRMGLDAWAKASGGQVPEDLVLAELERAREDSHTLAQVLQAQGVRFLHLRQPAEAAESFRRAWEVAEAASIRQEYTVPALPWLATALREEAERTPALAVERRNHLLRQALEAARRGHRLAFRYRNNLPHALRERGLVTALLGRPHKGRALLERSLLVARQLGMRHEETLSREALERLESDGPGKLLEPEGPPGARETLSLVDRFPRVLEAGRRLASALSEEAVVAAARDALQELLRAEEVFVLRGATLEELERAAAESPAGPGASSLRRMVDLGRPVTLSDEEPDSGGGAPLSTSLRGAVCAPIFVRGELAGCCGAIHRQVKRLFGEEEVRLAQYVATLAGAALENARNFGRVEALSEERGRLYEQAQVALRLRDDFLAIAAHELKTPLTALSLQLQAGVAALARTGGPQGSPVEARLQASQAQTQRLARLVDELLNVASIEQERLLLTPREVDLAELVRDVLLRHQPSLERAGCQVESRLPESLPGWWDPLRLEQVVANLLENAAKYGAGYPVMVTLEGEGEWARLTVSDRGIGISPEDQARIFERFERAVSVRHYGGFGLGLWIVRQIVEAMGGRVRVASQPEQGSTFTVELPRVAQARPATPPG